MRTTSTLLIAIMMTAACGGGDGHDTGTVNETAARSAVDETGTIADAMATADGPGAASGVVSLFAASQLILAPGQARIAPAVQSAIVGTAECTPVTNGMSTCTFSLYGDDNPDAGYMLDGTIVKNMDDTYVFDLTYDVTTMTSSYHWVMTGSLITSPTVLDGLIHLDGSGTGPAGDVDWEISVDYQEIQLDGNRCPRGGSIYTISTYSSEGTEIYDIDGDLVFALACA